MKNIKLILISLVILFVVSSVVLNNIQSMKIEAQKEEIDRVQSNNIQLMAENSTQTTLILKEKELTGKVLAERDSLAKALQIHPKQITKIVTNTVTIHDTIPVPVPVYISGQNFWKIKDSGPCFKWHADAFLSDDSLSVNRTLFFYSNKTTDVYYKERSRKFLFIKFGKWQFKQETGSECGENITKEIQFLK